ncbi:MAG: hypothetical protein ACFB02_07290 [Mastigocoleus sp.]
MNIPESEGKQNGSSANNFYPAQENKDSTVIKKDYREKDFGESNNLSRVRDILFGNQMRDIEDRFSSLENRLMDECNSLRNETRKRLDVLENYIKQEVDSIADRLKKEQQERQESLNSLVQEYKSSNISLEKKLSQLEEKVNNEQRELREQVLHQSQTLQDDILQKYQEILHLVQTEGKDIRQQKTDRSTLAALFADLAVQINSQV